MAAISLERCSLDLPIYGTINRSLKGAIMSGVTGGSIAHASRRVSVVEAVKEVSLELRDGDRLGLVGHNGAGKTSLLKLMAGIYTPSSGRCDVQGRRVSLLDMTMGLDMEATGLENIRLRGLMQGLDRQQLRELTPAICEFSGLGEFLRLPVRTYSSGMLLRLAFAIVSQVEAEVLLMDEWIGVGDADFMRQADKRLHELVDKANILVLASHNADLVRDVCNLVARLEHGRLVALDRTG
ncbi:ABC transporter ATP-binding protein [Arenimonas sp.]|uniref:ABC transporter ATP-binding protein n=1 Tax=Arenimonas sp. TaxID=1872635 RepID=UPI0039E40C4F